MLFRLALSGCLVRLFNMNINYGTKLPIFSEVAKKIPDYYNVVHNNTPHNTIIV
jgi:hypothetical protein